MANFKPPPVPVGAVGLSSADGKTPMIWVGLPRGSVPLLSPEGIATYQATHGGALPEGAPLPGLAPTGGAAAGASPVLAPALALAAPAAPLVLGRFTVGQAAAIAVIGVVVVVGVVALVRGSG